MKVEYINIVGYVPELGEGIFNIDCHPQLKKKPSLPQDEFDCITSCKLCSKKF